MCATCDAAWAAFDDWLSKQSPEVQEKDLSDQIVIYATTDGRREVTAADVAEAERRMISVFTRDASSEGQ